MSDGNYNRNLLPYTKFQSGLRSGEGRMRHRAEELFASWLEMECSDWEDERRDAARQWFAAELKR